MLNPKVVRRAELAFLTSVGSVAAKIRRKKKKKTSIRFWMQLHSVQQHRPPQPWECCLWQIPLSGGVLCAPADAQAQKLKSSLIKQLWKSLVNCAEEWNSDHLLSKNQQSILSVSVWKITKETSDKKKKKFFTQISLQQVQANQLNNIPMVHSVKE